MLVVGVIPPLLWAVTRCFARAGIRPLVLGGQRLSPLAWLRDCEYRALPALRDAARDPLEPALVAALEAECERRAIDVIVPADYECSLLLARAGALRCQAQACALPDLQTLCALHDKWRFACLLERLGLPHPRTELATTPHALVRTQLPFPIVTKPTDRWAGIGFQIHRSQRALAYTLAENRLRWSFPLLAQRYVHGTDVGFGFLARHGKLVAGTAFVHSLRGRRHFSSRRLRRCVEVLLEETGYHGVGEVDARRDARSGEYRLLELNPRFWASLLFAANGGLNFPELLLRVGSLAEAPGLSARAGEARLPLYESLVRRASQVSQLAHDIGRAALGV